MDSNQISTVLWASNKFIHTYLAGQRLHSNLNLPPLILFGQDVRVREFGHINVKQMTNV